MALTKYCTEVPFCAKKSRKNPLFGPDCARVASRKSAKTAQFVCFYKHFMTFCFCRPPPADTLRRVCNSAQMEGRISESANPQGLAENIYERHIFNRYIFADYKSLYLVTWDCKFHAAGFFGCTYDREILRQDTFWGRWNGVAVDVFLSRKTFCKTVSFVVLPC